MLPQVNRPYEMISAAEERTTQTSYPQHQQVATMKKTESSSSKSCSSTNTTSTTKKKEKKQSKKSVQWYPKVKLWYLAYRTDEDYEAIWYDQDDYARFKEDSRKTIAMVARRRVVGGPDSPISIVIPDQDEESKEEQDCKEEEKTAS